MHTWSSPKAAAATNLTFVCAFLHMQVAELASTASYAVSRAVAAQQTAVVDRQRAALQRAQQLEKDEAEVRTCTKQRCT